MTVDCPGLVESSIEVAGCNQLNSPLSLPFPSQHVGETTESAKKYFKNFKSKFYLKTVQCLDKLYSVLYHIVPLLGDQS